MDIEKLKLYLDFGKFFLGTFLIGLITFVVKSGLESREIAIKESEQIGKYVEIALREDVGVRKRFAEYFKTVTVSDRYRKRWTDYYELVKGEFDVIKRESALIAKEIDSLRKLVVSLKDSSDVMREDYLYQIDELAKEKAVLEAELEVKPETRIPDAYQIVLNSLNPIAKVKSDIIKYMNDKGFTHAGGTDNENRQSWMADKSTVFYYSAKSRFVAEKIASDLKALTGMDFSIQMREDPGRKKAQKDYSFVIHYIN